MNTSRDILHLVSSSLIVGVIYLASTGILRRVLPKLSIRCEWLLRVVCQVVTTLAIPFCLGLVIAERFTAGNNHTYTLLALGISLPLWFLFRTDQHLFTLHMAGRLPENPGPEIAETEDPFGFKAAAAASGYRALESAVERYHSADLVRALEAYWLYRSQLFPQGPLIRWFTTVMWVTLLSFLIACAYRSVNLHTATPPGFWILLFAPLLIAYLLRMMMTSIRRGNTDLCVGFFDFCCRKEGQRNCIVRGCRLFVCEQCRQRQPWSDANLVKLIVSEARTQKQSDNL